MGLIQPLKRDVVNVYTGADYSSIIVSCLFVLVSEVCVSEAPQLLQTVSWWSLTHLMCWHLTILYCFVSGAIYTSTFVIWLMHKSQQHIVSLCYYVCQHFSDRLPDLWESTIWNKYIKARFPSDWIVVLINMLIKFSVTCKLHTPITNCAGTNYKYMYVTVYLLWHPND